MAADIDRFDQQASGYWHSDHYDNRGQYTDLLSGPIWDALTDHPEGLTVVQIRDVLARDLRVRAGMSYYLSFGEEQHLRAGAQFEDAYIGFPLHGTPEQRFRYTLAERIAYRLELLAGSKSVRRKLGNHTKSQVRRTRSPSAADTLWVATDKPPKVWEPKPEQCPACGRKNQGKGSYRDWVYGEGTGPSVHVRTSNLLDDIAEQLEKSRITSARELLAEAAFLLGEWYEGRGGR